MAENDATPQAGDSDKPPAPPAPTVPLETVERLVSSFKDGMKEVVAAIPAPVAPVAADPVAAAKKRYDDARARATEIAKDDPVAAFELLATTIQAEAPKSDPTLDPAYRALRSQAKRLAATDATTKAVLDKYGPEVEAIVAGMTPARQIDVGAWEEAVGIARGKHYDELIAEERKTWEADAAKRAPAPTAGGSRARTATGAYAGNLTPDQLGVAKSFGMTAERYAQVAAELSANTGADGAVIGVELLPPGEIQPGKF